MKQLTQYINQVEIELQHILQYWIDHAPDYKHGGFLGALNHKNIADFTAPKGIVLNARILWTFSAAYQWQPHDAYLMMAERAFDYLMKFGFDHEYGGVFWKLLPNGNVLDDRKQIYAHAFVIYGLSEFYAATNNKLALDTAIGLFHLLEEKSFDANYGGYFEAFSRNWAAIDDARLSEKDRNEKKTMNTHLHIIEAYANLYKVWPNKILQSKIIHLLHLFQQYFIDIHSFHLNLFFTENWQLKPDVVSYGHDIEAAWLLLDCAVFIGDIEWIYTMEQMAIAIAIAAAEGLDDDGGLWYEKRMADDFLIREKHWWPQAEAMIGFLNAWQITQQTQFFEKSWHCWQFVKEHIIDKKYGEWVWGVDANYQVMLTEDKIGFWKCPYHNARACMEIIQRLSMPIFQSL
ncbi:MAG: N-acyl-D-glucosamine 2-epimerase [Sphingobacteriales bacterium]|uniref:AGE family epimerase/isomerase n=1 Tax=Hydrotalea flava TaxID=714549 RepID=UPI000832F359|nr:AGE family epimerase/isomerase [Hydrotalea flava]RTL48585.1 MAG: N-acyl-D-glucosamine 2-epimerase [Sphingobacteriales bacterium]